MAGESAAASLAGLAGMLRAEATNGLFWGAGDDELARLRLLRRRAAALMAEVDHRPKAELEACFDTDVHLRSPWPATEFRIHCADGERLVQRRRLRRGGDSLGRRLAELGQALGTEAPSVVSGIADTGLAGLPCPHTFLIVYEAATSRTAAEVGRRLAPSDPDLDGPVEALPPAESAVDPQPAPVPVSPAAKAILNEVARVAAEGVAAAANVYDLERHERVMALCGSTVETDLAYPRLDCGDLAAEPLSTAADAAIFDARNRLLLIRRTDTGQWAMPGGAAEVGETVGMAAVREAFEETGLDIGLTGLACVSDRRESGLADSRFPMIMSFSARLNDPDQPIRLAELEASDSRWITPDEIEGIDFFGGHGRRVRVAFAAHAARQPRPPR